MSLIQGSKSIDITKESGSGEKAGEAEQWLNKEPAEQVEQLTDIAIVCTLQHSMQTLWKNILCLK